ncbi:hypothetical protein LEP1GSC047_3685 [Leptospira inadai serovar Lyme str. 10]|uniref:Uncharacterized protein n=1 Tax=Leptospira inadai serovar Lyme str. 10 TaxID=1049790 RepID=V6HEQ7_9LEPT|nr:hypothetical protein LEP1GSC047_3685 [Leptospira inadai serovar Lyme str. 10]
MIKCMLAKAWQPELVEVLFDRISGKKDALSKSTLRSREGKLKFLREELFRNGNSILSKDRYNPCNSMKNSIKRQPIL